MHVLFLNQPFYPDVAATGQHVHDLGEHLVQQGHRVTVVASRSLYGRRGGKLPKREVVDGIEVYRVGVNLFGKGPLPLRMIDFALFYLLATWRVLRVRRVDAIVCLTTPPMIALVGVAMKALKRCQFVYWVMDLYPDVLVACDVLSPRNGLTWALTKINNLCIRRSDRTVVLGRCMKRRLMGKGLPGEKVSVIRVWGDVAELSDGAGGENRYRALWHLENKFVVMYSGNFGLGHDVRTMCDAAERLRHREDIRFVFAGGGKHKKCVEDFLAGHKLGHAQCQPYQPREQLGALLSLADVHLASLIEPLSGVIVPSKVFGIMAAGRPTLFIGPADSEAAQLLHEHGCGQTFRPGDGETLAAAIERLADHREQARAMGERGREAMLQHYDRVQACGQWEQLLSSLIRHRGAAAPRDAEEQQPYEKVS